MHTQMYQTMLPTHNDIHKSLPTEEGNPLLLVDLHNTISTAIVDSKARVCPTKNEKSIPKLELVAAYLLTKLLVYVAQHL